MNWGAVAAAIAVISGGISVGAWVQSTSSSGAKLKADVELLSQRLSAVERNQGAAIHESAGTITVNGNCFRPRKLIRCRSSNDHLTWVDNLAECSSASLVAEGDMWILAQCN